MPRTDRSGGSSGAAVTVVNDLTTGGATAALSATQGVTLKGLVDALGTGRLLDGSGVPGAGVGNDGDMYMRTDAPFIGALYAKAAGAWSATDNAFTLGTLPTAAVGYLGVVARVTDSVLCPTGKDFVCVTYDAVSYYWRPVDGRWMIWQTNGSDSAAAGTNADVTVASFSVTTPNRADMFPVGMRIKIHSFGVFTGTAGAKSIQVKALTMSGGSTSTLCGMGASGATTLAAHVENEIWVTASNTGQSYPFTGWTGNTSTASFSTYSGANWHNLAITFTKNGVSAADTVKIGHGSIEFIYPS